MIRARRDAVVLACLILMGCDSCASSLVSDPAVRNQPVPATLHATQSFGAREITRTSPWDVDGRQVLSLETAFTPDRVGDEHGSTEWYLMGTQVSPLDPGYTEHHSRLWYINETSTAWRGGRAGIYRWMCTAFRFDPTGPVLTVAVDRLPDGVFPQTNEGPIAKGQVVTRWLSTAGTTEIHFAEGPGQRGSVAVMLGAGRTGPESTAGWNAELDLIMGVPGGVPAGTNPTVRTLNPADRDYQRTLRAMDARVEILRTELAPGARFHGDTSRIDFAGPLLDLHVLVAVTRQ